MHAVIAVLSLSFLLSLAWAGTLTPMFTLLAEVTCDSHCISIQKGPQETYSTALFLL